MANKQISNKKDTNLRKREVGPTNASYPATRIFTAGTPSPALNELVRMYNILLKDITDDGTVSLSSDLRFIRCDQKEAPFA